MCASVFACVPFYHVSYTKHNKHSLNERQPTHKLLMNFKSSHSTTQQLNCSETTAAGGSQPVAFVTTSHGALACVCAVFGRRPNRDHVFTSNANIKQTLNNCRRTSHRFTHVPKARPFSLRHPRDQSNQQPEPLPSSLKPM